MPAQIIGLAHHLPPDTAVAGVVRPILSEPGGPSDLALVAARTALSAADLGRDAVELIIFATMTPDVTFPGAACFFQDKLKCGTTGALDIRGQCTGFVMGLAIADSFLRAGIYRHVMLAAAEVHSPGLDYSPSGASVAALYGDGAAVAVLSEARGAAGIRAVVCHTDGRLHDNFWCEYPASRQHPVRVTVENLRAGRHFPRLDTAVVDRFGREHLPGVVNEVLHKAATTAERVDAFVLSHILPGVAVAAAEACAIPAAKLIDAGVRHGHLTAASLPVALSEAVQEGRLGPGATVCLAACGAGFTWGAAVLQL